MASCADPAKTTPPTSCPKCESSVVPVAGEAAVAESAVVVLIQNPPNVLPGPEREMEVDLDGCVTVVVTSVDGDMAVAAPYPALGPTFHEPLTNGDVLVARGTGKILLMSRSQGVAYAAVTTFRKAPPCAPPHGITPAVTRAKEHHRIR